MEAYNSASGETWHDYQKRQAEYNARQEAVANAERRMAQTMAGGASYQRKRRATDADYSEKCREYNREYIANHREEINAKRRAKYKLDKQKRQNDEENTL